VWSHLARQHIEIFVIQVPMTKTLFTNENANDSILCANDALYIEGDAPHVEDDAPHIDDDSSLRMTCH
jgi:hypothetical protein